MCPLACVLDAFRSSVFSDPILCFFLYGFHVLVARVDAALGVAGSLSVCVSVSLFWRGWLSIRGQDKVTGAFVV